MTEIRCLTPSALDATDLCGRLVMVTSDDFVGAVSTVCRRCRQDVRYPDGSKVDPIRLECSCGKWLASGVVLAGYLQVACRHERALVRLSPTGAQLLEESRRPDAPRRGSTPGKPPPLLSAGKPWTMDGNWVPSSQILPPTPVDIVKLIEERWELLRLERVHRSADIAVGLRFNVFSRDGFRCRYCGRGPDQGVYLEADHVTPRSADGPDTMANLVTACWDCNRGKSAKAIDAAALTA